MLKGTIQPLCPIVDYTCLVIAHDTALMCLWREVPQTRWNSPFPRSKSGLEEHAAKETDDGCALKRGCGGRRRVNVQHEVHTHRLEERHQLRGHACPLHLRTDTLRCCILSHHRAAEHLTEPYWARELLWWDIKTSHSFLVVSFIWNKLKSILSKIQYFNKWYIF